MEASGHARWFERLLAELQFELWIGDATEIRTKRVRKRKTDRQDAQLILRLLLEDRFPQTGCRAGKTGICGNAIRMKIVSQCREQAKWAYNGAFSRSKRKFRLSRSHRRTITLRLARPTVEVANGLLVEISQGGIS